MGNKFYTWAGANGQRPSSHLGRYDVPTGDANVIEDLREHQGDIKDVAAYIANRNAYPAYDKEDTEPYKYKFRTRRRKADQAGEAEPQEKKGQAAAEQPLIEPLQIKSKESYEIFKKNFDKDYVTINSNSKLWKL